jgi:hypothetical protein
MQHILHVCILRTYHEIAQVGPPIVCLHPLVDLLNDQPLQVASNSPLKVHIIEYEF